MKNKYAWVSLVLGAVLVLDQASKLLVMRHIAPFSSIRVIPGFFDLIYVRNPGAAFGILAGARSAWRVVFFVAISLAAMAVIAVLIRKTSDRLALVAYALIGGGALGNLMDRVRFGEVVDFIDWYYRTWHWPTFNIADSAITVGVGLLVVDMFLRKPENEETP
jgi:signal peptidase II